MTRFLWWYLIFSAIDGSSDSVSVFLKISGRSLPLILWVYEYKSVWHYGEGRNYYVYTCYVYAGPSLPISQWILKACLCLEPGKRIMTLLEQRSLGSWLPIIDLLMVYKWINNLVDYPSTLPQGMHHSVTIFIAPFKWGPSDFYSDLLFKTIIAPILLPIIKYHQVIYIILKS